MMEILDTEPGVIAVKLSGRLRGGELEEMTVLVERSLEEAYLQLTGTSVEFRAEDGTRTA